LIVVEDGGELRDTVAEIEEHAARTRDEKIAAGILAPDYPTPYIGWDALAQAISSHSVVYLGHSGESVDNGGWRGLIAPEMRFGGQLKGLLTRLRKLRNDGDRVVSVTMQAARQGELWQEQETNFVANTATSSEPPPPGSVTFVAGPLQEGWRLRTGSAGNGGGETHVFSDAEIFGWSRPEPRRRKPTKRARSPEGAYADLNEGDYVVHVDYGVGRFSGMRRRTI